MSREGKNKQKLSVLAIIIMVVAVYLFGKICFSISNKVVTSIIKESVEQETTTVAKGSKFEFVEPTVLDNAAVSYSAPKLKNEDQLNAFLNKYSGVWYMKKEFTEEEEWIHHDFGKKIAIFAFNRLNDYSTKNKIGTKTHTKVLLVNGVPVDSKSYSENIYGADIMHDGADIKYDEDLIILTPDYVDFSDLEGPMFSMEDFRYENIKGYDYIISDLYGFGLCFDGTYLEYVEPDSIGCYQGFYAFGSGSMQTMINQDYNDYLN